MEGMGEISVFHLRAQYTDSWGARGQVVPLANLGHDGGAIQVVVRPEVRDGVSPNHRFQGLKVRSQTPCKVVVMLRFLITAKRCQLRQKSPPAP